MAENSLKGKVVLVAGATGGIGRSLCQLLASQEATLAIVGRDDAALQNQTWALRAAGGHVTPFVSPLSSAQEWNALFKNVREHFGRLDVAIHAIGLLIPGHLDELGEKEIENVAYANLHSVIHFIRGCTPLMRDQRQGHIVVVGSLGGIVPMPYEALYSSMKFAVRGLVLSLRRELQDDGILLGLVSLGPVQTGMLDLEASDPQSSITFITAPITPLVAARAILKLLRHPRAEYIPGRLLPDLSRLVNIMPSLVEVLSPVLDFLGRAGLARYRLATKGSE
jgi:NAD(P)-dependent dehydrogenase (short-subunit alcohol dehydrogenase family)